MQTQVLVIGAGPGGYTAAFRAADLGKQVVLVDSNATLGGVCLNVGCIPSKALLHAAKVLTDAQAMSRHGIKFGAPDIDVNALRAYKDGIIGKLTRGLAGLARQRKVTVVQGTASFVSPREVKVTGTQGESSVTFEHCIIAAGSSVARIPGIPYDDPRVMDSTGALALADIPKRLLVIGGGIIGLEMATVYDALGSEVSVVEMADGLIPGADRDLVNVLQARMSKRLDSILLKTRVDTITPQDNGLLVSFTGVDGPLAKPLAAQRFDRVLVAVGRRPNGKQLSAEAAGVVVNEQGFIPVDRECRTNVRHIHAIGDVVGGPMLAHKASHEGRVAAEVIAGQASSFEPLTIPSIAYTDPEVAWMGLTETEAVAKGIAFEKGVFPWAASGRALANGRDDGITKLLVDPVSKKILGAGIVGVNAGELLAETVLALETGADIHTLMHAVHAHPTLSESVALAAEILDGSITDLYMPKR
jgi:dihydrolipoamide dehydrogenase